MKSITQIFFCMRVCLTFQLQETQVICKANKEYQVSGLIISSWLPRDETSTNKSSGVQKHIFLQFLVIACLLSYLHGKMWLDNGTKRHLMNISWYRLNMHKWTFRRSETPHIFRSQSTPNLHTILRVSRFVYKKHGSFKTQFQDGHNTDKHFSII